jgi:hypothetical protein
MCNDKICALRQRSPYTAIWASLLKNHARNGPAFVKTFSRSGKLPLRQAAAIACSGILACSGTPVYARRPFIFQWYIYFFIIQNDHPCQMLGLFLYYITLRLTKRLTKLILREDFRFLLS